MPTDVLEEYIFSIFIWLATCFHAVILLSLFDPEDGGDMFLQNFS
jgi:hypothetical protein